MTEISSLCVCTYFQTEKTEQTNIMQTIFMVGLFCAMDFFLNVLKRALVSVIVHIFLLILFS